MMPDQQFSAKLKTPVFGRDVCHYRQTVMGVVQSTCVPPIVTLFQVITKACENVNDVVQLTPLLSRDVTYTIDQLKNKYDKQSRKKKEKDDRNVT